MERTKYMNTLIIYTYPDVAIEAVKGGLKGAWERCIAKRLEFDVTFHSEAIEICESVGNDYMKAAHLITSSKIPQPCEL